MPEFRQAVSSGQSPRPAGRAESALRGLFDHAGMFPPAEKPLAAALQDAASFPTTLRRPGIIGADLVIAWKDWARLDDAALDGAGFVGPCRVAIVGLDPDTYAQAAPGLALRRQPTDRIVPVSLEVHVEGTTGKEFLARTALPVHVDVPTFLEPRVPAPELRAVLPTLRQRLRRPPVGLKVRCAGPHGLDRTTLAEVITATADGGIALKLTQGLHHPVPGRGFNHGFLNVLAAFRLRQVHGAAFGREMHACLGETQVEAFSLRDGISWRGFQAPASKLAGLPPFAIGSCSLTEPDDDLFTAFGAPRP